MRIHAREEYKNMIVTATEENGIFEVTACVNGKIVGRIITEDKNEAMEVYGEAVNEMYK